MTKATATNRKNKAGSRFIGVLAVLLVCGLSPIANAQSANKPVSTSITVAKFVNIAFTSASTALDFSVSDGGQAATYTSGTANFTAKSNTAFSISNSLTGYSGPGTLSIVNFSFTNPNAATAGTNGSLQIRLSGLTLTNATPQTNTSATVTLTVTAL